MERCGISNNNVGKNQILGDTQPTNYMYLDQKLCALHIVCHVLFRHRMTSENGIDISTVLTVVISTFNKVDVVDMCSII